MLSVLGGLFCFCFFFLGGHMWILFYIRSDFLLVSDDGYIINGASGFGVRLIQDYVVTDVY